MLKTRGFSTRLGTFTGSRCPNTLSARTDVKARNMLGNMSPAALQEAMKDPATREAMQKAMQNPQFLQQMQKMQEALKNPDAQQQMVQMQSFLQNQKLQERMKTLKDDPEFADIFKDIQKNGMSAMMKYYNDPSFLAKLGDKISDVVPSATDSTASGAAPGSGAPTPQAAPALEITTLLDAAKHGDMEAVEDFIAIGKDVNMRDEEQRSPLHYAAAYAHSEIAGVLIESNADLEAKDSKDNTPLHYAAGYGRTDVVELLLNAGSNTSAKNSNGKTAADLVAQNPQNPLSSNATLLNRLKG
ncbi:hypothetical protein CEUSTIGMA_g12994.t1 [Chlamydomonas eustigma]|uniref:STI1/HOP DP domain-containing protein n=1 Tax=Chlamydomonas eustigma TaxID=1157962 RepID=A0A250XRK5_9CHLO|nr:hypothetical protein CEUSTIGMA_g12994.t1 [Chlamydomonas eustigma]|eukprot:GAX85579.1 hypothetical protein CEUSTIGMA_g12994.t1 [Chlamydomonas eustigma]